MTDTNAGDWAGRDLGERTCSYEERDVILYALAVGAKATDLDLIYEKRLRVLPSFGLTLAQWAPDILSEAGAFDNRAVHGSQILDVVAPLPRSGDVRLAARVGEVWDKGSAAIFNIIVESDYFTATWALFAPGSGGFGGDRGPQKPVQESADPDAILEIGTAENQAVLYRLLGDRHAIHIDPDASARIGQPRPILQGLCTLAAATLALADHVGAHPADLTRLEGRFSSPVVPGDRLAVRAWLDGRFQVNDGESVAISEGMVKF